MDCTKCPNKSQKYFKCRPVIQMSLFSFSGDDSDDVADIRLIEELLRINCEVKYENNR